MVADMSDDEIWRAARAAATIRKVYAAYKAGGRSTRASRP